MSPGCGAMLCIRSRSEPKTVSQSMAVGWDISVGAGAGAGAAGVSAAAGLGWQAANILMHMTLAKAKNVKNIFFKKNQSLLSGDYTLSLDKNAMLY